MQNRNNKWLRIILWALALGWGAVLFVFSGQTGPESGDLSRMFTEWLLRVFPGLPWTVWQLEPVLRKLAHFGIFAVEGLLLGLAIMETFQDISVGFVLAGMSCTIVAALNEFHQSLVAGRNGNGIDVWIDSAGALCGAVAAALLFWLAGRLRLRKESRL